MESHRHFRWNRPFPTVSCHLPPKRETLCPHPLCPLPMCSLHVRGMSCPVRALSQWGPGSSSRKINFAKLVGPRVHPIQGQSHWRQVLYLVSCTCLGLLVFL